MAKLYNATIQKAADGKLYKGAATSWCLSHGLRHGRRSISGWKSNAASVKLMSCVSSVLDTS